MSATLHYRGLVLQAHVSAAKAAVDALSQVVTVEYGPFGVRSNVIAPGAIGGTEGAERLVPKELNKQLTKDIPLGRLGTVDDIADCTGILDFEVNFKDSLHIQRSGELYNWNNICCRWWPVASV